MLTYLHAHLAAYRKGVIALTGALGQAVSLGMLHGTAQNVAQLVLAALTALGVYGVANAQPTDVGTDGEAGAVEIGLLGLLLIIILIVLILR